MPPESPSFPRRTPADQVWDKLIVSLEFADLADPDTRARLDSAAAKANNQGVQTAAAWRYARALPMLTAAIEIWSRLGQLPGEINARNVRGGVYRRLGDFAPALDDHRTALELAQQHSLASSEIAARWGLGAALAGQGDLDEAENILSEASAVSSGDPWGTGHMRRVLGDVHERRKHWDAARETYAAARAAFRAVVAPVEEIEVAAGLARVALASGYTLDAYQGVEQILQHLGEHGPARLDEPLRVYWTVYRVLYVMQQADEAREVLTLAYERLQQQADGLSEEDRARFLHGVETNRVIGEAWAAARLP